MASNYHVFPLRVHIEDTDFAGVVYHSQYLNFMERARSEWADEVGMGMIWQRQNHIYLPVVDVSIQYLKPARVHDRVEVISYISEIRRVSLSYRQYIRMCNNSERILCQAQIKIACVDESMCLRSLPHADWLQAIRAQW